MSEDTVNSPESAVTARERRDHAVVKMALAQLWRGGQGSRFIRRVAGSLDWAGYCAEIDALRAELRAEYTAAVQRGEIEAVDPEPDLDAALLAALHYFHAKEAPPLPLPPAALDSTGDLLRYFAQQAIAGRWKFTT